MLSINISLPDIALALYAETHYRFPLFRFSRYFKREPEIIVDLPYRCENGRLPVTIIVKDADKFPVEFVEPVKVEFKNAGETFSQEIEIDGGIITDPLWSHLAELIIPFGRYAVQAKFAYRCRKKVIRAVNHNHAGLKFQSMTLHSAENPLPRPAGYLLGDLHVHSSYTSDHVEFGAPLNAIARTAKAMGLDLAAVTDHTYDLDDLPDNYLKNDPELRKWGNFQQEIRELNDSRDSQNAHLIPGQEITARNHRGENVHFLLLNNQRLFPGSGDSAERWFRTNSEFSIAEILEQMEPEAIAGAAHPQVRIPFLQKLLLNRGPWRPEDLLPALNALQIANGNTIEEVDEGLHLWEEALEAGKRFALWAGNDAHGNFNRYRQVNLPMWNLLENEYHVLGKQFTGIHSPSGTGGCLDALKEGCTYISDGPGLDLMVDGVRPGGIVKAGIKKFRVEAVSSPEFGAMDDVEIVVDSGEDSPPFPVMMMDPCGGVGEFELPLMQGYVYARTVTDKQHFCVTSPVYVI